MKNMVTKSQKIVKSNVAIEKGILQFTSEGFIVTQEIALIHFLLKQLIFIFNQSSLNAKERG